MTTRKVRKQVCIHKRQEALLKRLARARGLSEAEIIRNALEQALEREAGGGPAQPAPSDPSAWQELVVFLERRQETATGGQPYRWDREEIYKECING